MIGEKSRQIPSSSALAKAKKSYKTPAPLFFLNRKSYNINNKNTEQYLPKKYQTLPRQWKRQDLDGFMSALQELMVLARNTEQA